MPTLLVVGGGLFGSQAAAYARSKGIEAVVFDPGLAEAASPAAAGLFRRAWFSKKLAAHYADGVVVLEKLYGIRRVDLADDAGHIEAYSCVSPTAILDSAPVRQAVTAVGDGWLEAGGRRYQGWVYIAAGIWSRQLVPGLVLEGRAGAALIYPGERPGRIRPIAYGRQAVAFVRDSGSTHFGDGTATTAYTNEDEKASLARAAAFGLTGPPSRRIFGIRPYAPKGPLFQRLSQRTWLGTGGRKLGTVLGAAFARRLVEDELSNS